MLNNIETIVAELNELKAYRQQKFHALTYVVRIEASKKQKAESKVHKEHCNFIKWLDKENRRDELVAAVGEKRIAELSKLHELWFDDYVKVYSHYYKEGFLSGIFSKGSSNNQEKDKVDSYFNDLKTTNSVCDRRMDSMAIELKQAVHH